MDGSLEMVARFYTRHEAEWAQTFLTAAEIDSAIPGDDAGGFEPGLDLGSSVRVVVRAGDAERAHQVLNEEGTVPDADDEDATLPG